ncbi:MAG: TatD family hydrolase [Methylotenera sp.]|nr:TatD family hydrolase [Oligoflexia bacterium]
MSDFKGPQNELGIPQVGHIDAHCHLADQRLDAKRDQIIQRAGLAGISHFIQGGVGPEDWERQLALVTRYPGKISTTFGLHPWWISSHSALECEEGFEKLLSWLKRYRPRGLGELGLDHSPRQLNSGGGPAETEARQTEYFERQLKLASAEKLPLVLHIVHAHPQAQSILESFGRAEIRALGGIVHSFSGDLQAARNYFDFGLKISISGSVITRKSGKAFEKLKQAVVSLPLESLVIETDSPDQPPADWGGTESPARLNEPVTLLQVAAAIGRFKAVSSEAVLKRSRVNLEAVFFK